MAKHYGAWCAIGGLSLVLAACGGGSSSGDEGTTPPITQRDRIEPFETAAKTAAQAAVAQVTSGVAKLDNIQSVVLGAPAAVAVQKVRAAEPEIGTPLQVGISRDVSKSASVDSTKALLSWHSTQDGSAQVAAIAFNSGEAKGVRLGVLVRSLPAGAVLRFYGAAQGKAEQVSWSELQAQAAQIATSGADDVTAHTYWSPDFGGASTVLEVQIPAGADVSQVQLAVPRLSHYVQTAEEVSLKASGSCNVDAMCQPDYVKQARSVARMLFTRENGLSYYCTGTLLNDVSNSSKPYFLSANHCVSTQAQASTLITDWFYHSSACNAGGAGSEMVTLQGGATLLYASSGTDTSFVQLNRTPPAGVVYAGSYFGAAMANGSGIIDLHHPDGDMQKWSLGTVTGLAQCNVSNESCQSSNSSDASFYAVSWQQGTTEGGSSGSAAFYAIGSNRYVTGQLFGGSASCSARTGTDYFGRFDIPYKAKINQWLNPAT